MTHDEQRLCWVGDAYVVLVAEIVSEANVRRWFVRVRRAREWRVGRECVVDACDTVELRREIVRTIEGNHYRVRVLVQVEFVLHKA